MFKDCEKCSPPNCGLNNKSQLMSTDAWFADLLPTKWARRIAGLTLLSVAGAYNLPSLLPPSFLPAAPELLFSLRIILALTTALVGVLVVLVCVVLRANELQREASRSFWETER